MPELPYREYLSSIIQQNDNNYIGGIILLMLCISYALSKVTISLLFDKLRIYFFEHPLIKLLNKTNIKSVYW